MSTISVITPASSQALTTLDSMRMELANQPNAAGTTGLLTADDAWMRGQIDQISGEIVAYCHRSFGLETVAETFRTDCRYQVRRESPDPLRLSRFPVISVTSVVEGGMTLAATDFELESDLLYRLDANGHRIHWVSRSTIVITYTAGYAMPWSYTATTLAFAASGSHLTDTVRGLSALRAGDAITISGSAANSGPWKIGASPAAGDVVLLNPDGTAATIATEIAGPSVVLTRASTVPDDLEGAAISLLTMAWHTRGRDNAVRMARSNDIEIRYDMNPATGAFPPEIAAKLDRYRVWGLG